MLDLQGGVVEVVPVGEQAGDGLAAFVAVVDVVDQDVGGQGGEAGGDLSDVQVADVDGVQVVVDGGDVGAAGAASRKIGHESRISPQPALGINAVTTSAATSSARAHPGRLVREVLAVAQVRGLPSWHPERVQTAKLCSRPIVCCLDRGGRPRPSSSVSCGQNVMHGVLIDLRVKQRWTTGCGAANTCPPVRLATRWAMRWKPELKAFAATLSDRWSAAETY